jgi:hypothetical protein
MIKNIWLKYKEYIVVLIYLVVLFALFYFVVKPIIGRIDYNANLIQEKITVQENFKRKLGMIGTNEEQARTIEKDEEKLKVFISHDQEITLIERIEKMAEETDNRISIEAVADNIPNAKAKTASSKSKEENKDELKVNVDNNDYVKFKISIWGEYGNLIDFVRKIENMEYWSDVVTLEVSYREPEKIPVVPENPDYSTELYDSDDEAVRVIIDKGTASSVIEVIFYLNGKI